MVLLFYTWIHLDMAEKGDSSDEEPTIAEDVVVTKYKMAGDMANSKENKFGRECNCEKFFAQEY